MKGRRERGGDGAAVSAYGAVGWLAFRVLLFVAGLSLVGYIAYRYSFYRPPDHGTVYGIIFPLSFVLAVAGMTLAFLPYALARLRGQAGNALRGGLSVYGGVWMATGLLCASSLAQGAVAAPLGGSVDMLHMLFQHVFLPASVVALAWAPERVARWLNAPPEPAPAAAAKPAFGAGY
jgi:hypothetical protein